MGINVSTLLLKDDKLAKNSCVQVYSSLGNDVLRINVLGHETFDFGRLAQRHILIATHVGPTLICAIAFGFSNSLPICPCKLH